MKFFSGLLDTNKREVNELERQIETVADLRAKLKKTSDSGLKKKTDELKKRLVDGETIEKILPEAFALISEASTRAIGMTPYKVQLISAAALFKGHVSEQKTGEGKTLSAVPALFTRALAGKGVHLVTVNDYLARRDAGWNGPTFHMLGMTVGVISGEQKSYIYDPDFVDETHGDERLSHLKPVSRAEAYKADVTYGTNNEFGFDYLRDNMVSNLSETVQRGHYFVIVDEVDSVLIDEARTPLIISAPDMEPTEKYYAFSKIVDKLTPDEDYKIDEKSRSASLTEAGIERVEKVMGIDNLYEKDFEAIHHIENALRARSLYLRDREYVVRENEVVIVDEFTGRLMPGRRWSDGLHQAVEAKEGVKIQQESKTLATISFQNYFRMYKHLSGMTGTASTEAAEFKKIYNLDVVVIPTHRNMVRVDHRDVVYKTVNAKYEAIAKDVLECNKKGQPVLIGTTSIEKNEIISEFLKKKKIDHLILNAKNHENEAKILAEAGKPGAVTVATNMAGRGVDIILGGTPPQRADKASIDTWKETKKYKDWQKNHEIVVAAGGLHVIGTERHESRRIDNQLRGRAGRQGDAGSTRFYLSLEDDLMRIFGGEQIKGLMDRLKLPEDQPIENGLVSKAIEQSQVKVEGFHFDQRKRLVEYDDVANQQREIVYTLRRRILEGGDIKEEILRKLEQQVERILLLSWPEYDAAPDYEKIAVGLSDIIPFDDDSRKRIEKQISTITDKEKLTAFLANLLSDAYNSREAAVTSTSMREIEKFAYLGAIDHLWIDHIDHIDGLREGVMLRSYGQRDPLVEFKKEAYDLFERLLDRIDEELAHRIFRIQLSNAPLSEIPLNVIQTNVDPSDQMGLVDAATKQLNSSSSSAEKKSGDKKKKVGRNDLCECGSGKKWKKCGFIHTPEHERLMRSK